MKKSQIVGICIIALSLISIIPGFSQDIKTEFTYQDQRGVDFAEGDAIKAIESGELYIISGGEGNEPIVDEKDLGIVKGLPMKSIGCMGNFEYAKKFNKAIIHHLKQKNSNAEELTKEQIIQIATVAAEEEDLNLDWRTIVYDEGNKYWEEKYKTINKDMAPQYEFLKSRNYQAVLFALKEDMLGGDVWFFIDKNTGEILTLYGEK